MKLVKNDMVSMDWDADGFIVTKKIGLVAAVHNYNGVAVAFSEGKVYTMIDDDGKYSFKDMVTVIKRAVKENDCDFPNYYDDYAEIYNGEFTKSAEILGLTEFEEDILARLEDLSGYWSISETAM